LKIGHHGIDVIQDGGLIGDHLLSHWMERPPSGLKLIKHLPQAFAAEYTKDHLDAEIGLFAEDTLRAKEAG
jgi:hypothetical protein